MQQESAITTEAAQGQLAALAQMIGVVCGLAWVGAVAMSCADRLFHGAPLGWNILATVPASWIDLVILPIMAGFLAIDLINHGGQNGGQGLAFNRLFSSLRYDLFFALADATGAAKALQVAFSFGLASWFVSLFSPLSCLKLAGTAPFWAQIPVIYLVASFAIYWGHRFMHTRLMWPLHALHHSVTDMTALSDSRGHPLDDAIRAVPINVGFALIGFSPEAALIAGLLARLHSALNHSRAPFPMWLERWVICGPRYHRVHHAVAEQYRNRNFGIVVLWDRLFGTFTLPDDARSLVTGVDDPRFDTGHPIHDMLGIAGIWLRGLVEEAMRYRVGQAMLAWSGMRPSEVCGSNSGTSGRF